MMFIFHRLTFAGLRAACGSRICLPPCSTTMNVWSRWVAPIALLCHEISRGKHSSTFIYLSFPRPSTRCNINWRSLGNNAFWLSQLTRGGTSSSYMFYAVMGVNGILRYHWQCAIKASSQLKPRFVMESFLSFSQKSQKVSISYVCSIFHHGLLIRTNDSSFNVHDFVRTTHMFWVRAIRLKISLTALNVLSSLKVHVLWCNEEWIYAISVCINMWYKSFLSKYYSVLFYSQRSS